MKRARILAGAFVALMSAAFVPMGCSSNQVGSVTATHAGGANLSTYPDKTVERFRGCVAEHGSKLGDGNHAFDAKVEMGEDGLTYGVEVENLPASAEDFGGCMRAALQSMAISEKLLDEAREKLKVQREQALVEQKKLLGSPVVVVVGVTIVVSEVVLEAGAITILFATTVELIDRAAKDVAELAKKTKWQRHCQAMLTTCLGTSLQKLPGRVRGAGRCIACWDECKANEGVWPSTIKIDGIKQPCL